MKWPSSVMLIRHDTSAYNVLRAKKNQDPVHARFVEEFEKDPTSKKTVNLAKTVHKKYALGVSDANTLLADKEGCQAFDTGKSLRKLKTEIPDVIFVSPYLRAKLTLEHIIRGWPALHKVRVHEEDRIREQDHGLSLLYNDWRVFHTFHPDQRLLYKLMGPYWYTYPQGENVPDVRARNRSMLTTLTRDFAGERVLMVTHHLNILAMRANLERWDEKMFIYKDENEKPINSGVTLYRGYPNKGTNGWLMLEYYNRKLY
jgi:broad specificity phosphatase PhoE